VTPPGGIGIVLSSGGIRGIYAHTGFLLALRRLGVPIAAISGCSAIACVCGMPPMVEAVKERLAAMGIAEDDVYLNF